jgi:hypothetical protein
MAILMNKMQQEYHLLKHLKKRGTAKGDEALARKAEAMIEDYLQKKYAATVYANDVNEMTEYDVDLIRWEDAVYVLRA